MADKIELLAPAGTWRVLEKVAEAGADAVYIGGKKFNMRMLKGDYNFTDDEIKAAASFLHEQKKKLYITINNLYFENEIHEIKDYLQFLEEVEVDALIVQDLGIINIYQELRLTLPLHASVQMGIANHEAVNFLERQGFSRVILSKNLSLEEIRKISEATTMGIEIFAHGDLCISHAGQCHMSSFIAGASGNRGRCIKPCRWQYKLDSGESQGYYLSHNDLSLYPAIPDLIKAGVSSLKIEGRMREAEYLAAIISLYRRAIDDIYKYKDQYEMNQEQWAYLESLKIRNLTTAAFRGESGRDLVDITGVREPAFLTKPRKLKLIEEKECYTKEYIPEYQDTELAVKIGNLQAVPRIKDYCDTIIIGLEQFSSDNNLSEIIELMEISKEAGLNVKLETPRIVTQKNWEKIISWGTLKGYDNLAGFIVNDLGSMSYLLGQGFHIWGGPGLNITNSKTDNLFHEKGISGLCFSPELKLNNIKQMPIYKRNWEIMIHGPLLGIITDYPILNIYPAIDNEAAINNEDRSLVDEFNQKYRLCMDAEDRTYIYYPYELCLYNYLPDLLDMGITRMRIDGQFYDNDKLMAVTSLYQQRLQAINNGIPDNNLDTLLQLFAGKLSDLSFSKPNI